jgi:hypothetical protein
MLIHIKELDFFLDLDLYGDYLILEFPVFGGSDSPGVAFGGEGILFQPADIIFRGDIFGRVAHMITIDQLEKAVIDPAVDNRAGSISKASIR